MKASIHPQFVTATATCGCGNTFTTISTVPELRVEICSECHPYYTGKQKFVDTAGRVQKFEKRFQWNAEELAKKKSAAARKAPKEPKKQLPKKTKDKAKKKEAAAPAASEEAASSQQQQPQQPSAEAQAQSAEGGAGAEQ